MLDEGEEKLGGLDDVAIDRLRSRTGKLAQKRAGASLDGAGSAGGAMPPLATPATTSAADMDWTKTRQQGSAGAGLRVRLFAHPSDHALKPEMHGDIPRVVQLDSPETPGRRTGSSLVGADDFPPAPPDNLLAGASASTPAQWTLHQPGRLFARISGSNASGTFFEARGATYNIVIEDADAGGGELAAACHRFSHFRALHSEIAGPLRLAPFPAWRCLLNTAAVRREREQLLPVFLNDALDALAHLASNDADVAESKPAKALRVFIGLDVLSARTTGNSSGAPSPKKGKSIADEGPGAEEDDMAHVKSLQELPTGAVRSLGAKWETDIGDRL